MAIHSELFGDNVHQPKGAHLAQEGQTLKASGSGTTSWVDLFIRRLLKLLNITSSITTATSITPITLNNTTVVWTDKQLTNNTGISEPSSEVAALDSSLDEEAEALRATINQNFAAVAKKINDTNTELTTAITNIDANYTSLETSIQTINDNTKLLANKINELITLLQELNIAREN